MSVSDADIAFALELFDDLGPLTTRKMMGGLCLYRDGTIFAVVHADGSIWIKGAGAFQDVLDARGLARWTGTSKTGKTTAMPYWRLPDAMLDDAEAATDLAREALGHL
ncbi:MAG: TfoX/Sxy family protein [Roseicyclus sp.]|uniref:TfoX/Sxy family protein n=1 Tax=Boseongicola sp. H5 TaxID=2763261 RepID=UPI001B2D47D0|nr:TfoX/Sxy family protein [Boseongicola sp. H5]MBO6603660.1 TfoX/Sxy family protein [Roseicyclus sp.]MBO6624022.1 TfoX/Sxy family protein [Roseicyclus sp.]MBO6923879.1 TfoX/Sxy family protein [Roseicyclus sp.]